MSRRNIGLVKSMLSNKRNLEGGMTYEDRGIHNSESLDFLDL